MHENTVSVVEVGYNRASLQHRKRINRSKKKEKQRLFRNTRTYTSGREHSLRRGFGFTWHRVLATPLTFLRFDLRPSTAAASASTDPTPTPKPFPQTWEE